MTLERACIPREHIAIGNLWSSRGNSGRCGARRTLVEGYDTRALPFTLSEVRLRALAIKYTRATSGSEIWGRTWLSQPRGSSLRRRAVLSVRHCVPLRANF